MDRPRTNWAGNIDLGAGRVHRPTSVEGLRYLVGRSPRVRALGAGHSFNDIVAAPGALVSLDGLPRAVDIDTARGKVRVGAGVRYAELGWRLDRQGFGLPALASLPHVTVAGACATATHGAGDTNGVLATAVSELELITAGGDLVTLDRDTEPDRFDGSVVALGALGVVASVTLDLVPAFEACQWVYEELPLTAAREHLDDILASGHSVSMFTDWRGPSFTQVWVKRRVDDPAPWPTEHAWFAATPADGPRHPVGLSAAACTEQMGVPGPWYERLPHFRPDAVPSSGEELQSEYLVPRDRAAEALRAIDALRDRIGPLVRVSEVRSVAADGLWLSPCYGRDTVGIHMTWVNDFEAVREALGPLETALAGLEARPHWAKLFAMPPPVLESLYPRLPDFGDLVRHYDPGGKFRNAFVERHVLGWDVGDRR